MEKVTNRDKYFQSLYEICEKVELNQKFIDLLSNHPYFRAQMKSVKRFEDIKTQKVIILLEFTRLRSTCEEIIKLLKLSDQTEVALELEKYNTSPGRMEVTTNDEIAVKIGKEMKGTLYYEMSRNPRGKCVIINNFVNFSNGKILENEGLYKESKRFQSIFSQLYFDVYPIHTTVDMTAKAIENTLKSMSRDRSIEKPDALIVMIISHGRDEKVLGYDACRLLDDEDLIKISDIVDIFSETNCKALEQRPKLFFFNCCRIKTECNSVDVQLSPNDKPTPFIIPKSEFKMDIQLKPFEKRVIVSLKTVDQKWTNLNRDTFISYSCSEGYPSFYDKNICISHFGQALSHSIAQYACEESLQSILSRTCDFIDKYYSETALISAPEIRGQFMRRQLFFNPGFFKSS